MEYRDIRIGTRLELLRINAEGEPEGPVMTSRLETVREDGTLVVLAPMREMSYIALHPDDPLDVLFEAHGERCVLRATVLDRVVEENLRLFHLWPESEIVVIQRRDFYRLPHVMACEYRPMADPETPQLQKAPWRRTLTRNIGGGGIGLLFEDKPEMGMNIEGKLEADGTIRFTGKVVRITPCQETAAYRYEAGIAFDAIANRDRERLIALIYEVQRNLLRKGWTGA